MNIKEIQEAIAQLQAADRAKIADWLEEFQGASGASDPAERDHEAYLKAVQATLADEWESEEDNRAYNDL